MYLTKAKLSVNNPTRQAGKAKSPRYAGLLAVLRLTLRGLGAGCGVGAVLKNTRAMSSMVGGVGSRFGFVGMA